jgi:hypothetical protein
MDPNVSTEESKQPGNRTFFYLISAKLALIPLAGWIEIGRLFMRGVALLGVLCGSYHALKTLIALAQQTNNLAAPQHSLNIFALEIPLLALIWAITKLCQEE